MNDFLTPAAFEARCQLDAIRAAIPRALRNGADTAELQALLQAEARAVANFHSVAQAEGL